jgi:hypothetical protein
MQTLSRIALGALFAGAVSLPATASDGDYSVKVDGVQLTGAIDLNDSTGNAQGVSGTATGVVEGKFTLDYAKPEADIPGNGVRLVVKYSQGSQTVTARLDTCTSPTSCTQGAAVTVWEK